MKYLLPWLVLAFTSSSCSHLKFWETSEDSAAENQSSGAPAPLSPKEVDLKIAELHNRIIELEEEQLRQKEKMHLIRKAVVLGIVPDELRMQFYEERDAKPMAAPKPRAKEESSPVVGAPVDSSAKSETIPQPAQEQREAGPNASPSKPPEVVDEKVYQSKLSQAQSLFGGAKYGEAIAVYSAIGRDFPASLTKGNHYYWIGLSWYYLKEYDFASKNLQEVVNSYPESPHVPRARFFLAKVEVRKGLKEKALSHFREIITAYPQDEAAEMAKAEIKNLEETL